MGIKANQFNIEGMSMELGQKYFEIESEWIDQEFTKNWPKIYSSFAKWANNRGRQGKGIGFIGRILTYIFARSSGLTIRRSKHLNMLNGGKGFRPGFSKTVLDAITVTLLRGNKEVASRRFELSLIK